MKRVFYAFILSLFVALSVWATPITVSSVNIPNYNFDGSSARLRIVSNNTFSTSDGVSIVQGSVGKLAFYKEITCNVALKVVTCPSFTIDSTTDSSNSQATYSAYLFDAGNVLRANYLLKFAVPTSLGTTVSWKQILLYNQANPLPTNPSYYTTDQVNSLIAGISSGGGGASVETVVTGTTGFNAAIAAAVAAPATRFTIKGNGAIAVLSNLTIPANVSFQKVNNTVITVASGVTLTFNAAIDAPAGQQVFDVSASGASVNLRGSPTKEVTPEMFGSAANNIQLAVNSIENCTGSTVEACQGKIVRLARTTYNLTSTLHLAGKLSLIGAGGGMSNPGGSWDQTVLSFPAGTEGIHIDYVGADSKYAQNIVLENFLMTGNKANATRVTGAYGVHVTSPVFMRDVTIINFADNGVFVDSGGGRVADTGRFVGVQSNNNNGDGFLLSGVDANIELVMNCTAESNLHVGFHETGNANGSTYIANFANYNGDADYFNDGGQSTSVYIGNYAEQSGPGADSFGVNNLIIGGIEAATLGGKYPATTSRGGIIRNEAGMLQLCPAGLTNTDDNAKLNCLGFRVNNTSYGKTTQVYGIPAGGLMFNGDVRLTSASIQVDVGNITANVGNIIGSKGIFSKTVTSGVVPLTYASTIAIDASQGNYFYVTLTGNATLGVPTNPVIGQVIRIKFTQDATGSRTLTLPTGYTGFNFGTDVPNATLSTAASKSDFLTAIYDEGGYWRVIDFKKGY